VESKPSTYVRLHSVSVSFSVFSHVCSVHDNVLHTWGNEIKTRSFTIQSHACIWFAVAVFRCGICLGWGIILYVGNHDTWVCGTSTCSHIFSVSLSRFASHMRKTRTEMEEKIKSRSKHKEREKENATKMVCNYRYLQCSQHNLYPLKLPPIMQYFCSMTKKIQLCNKYKIRAGLSRILSEK
jgi:hypothetical protein